MDEIPFVMIGKSYDESAIKEIIPMSETRMNVQSWLLNSLYYQGHERLFVWGAKEEEAKMVGENTISFSENPDGKVESIKPADPAALERAVRNLDDRIWKIGLLQRHAIVSDQSKQVQSAESKAADVNVYIEWCDKILDLVQKKFTKVYKLTAELQGLEEEVAVVIDRDYRAMETQYELSSKALLYSQANQLGLTDVQKELVKISINRLEVDDDTKERLIQSVDSLPDSREGRATNRLIGILSPEMEVKTQEPEL